MDIEPFLSTIEDAQVRDGLRPLLARLLSARAPEDEEAGAFELMAERCFDAAQGGTETGRILFELANQSHAPGALWPAFLRASKVLAELLPGAAGRGRLARLLRAAGRAAFKLGVHATGRFGHGLLNACVATAQAELRQVFLLALAAALQRSDAAASRHIEPQLARYREALAGSYAAQVGETLARQLVAADEALMRARLGAFLAVYG